MFNKPIKAKVVGFFMLIPAILILLGTITAIIILPAFGFASGVSFLALLPFFILMFFVFCFSAGSIYFAIRYLKNNPFKENKSLGSFLVIFSIGYFLYSLLGCLFSNLTGNEGGYLRPVITFLLLLVLLPLGLGLKNGYKKS